MVDRCHGQDKERRKKFPNVPGLTNKQIDALADLIMDSIRVSGRLGNQPCHDDTGVYKNGVYLKNGFDFERHSMFSLSLDRIDNEEPHFSNADV
jgi:hypothetical protein